jgi:isocitrate dehydrogenase (NAD+)
MKKYKVAVLPGDGIGPEVVDAAVKVLKRVEKKSDSFELELLFGKGGDSAVTEFGTNVPQETIDLLKETDVCLKGPMTTLHDKNAPVSASLTIRRLFDLYANIRPFHTLPNVPSLKPDIDFIIVRENLEGLYSSNEFMIGEDSAISLKVVTRRESERVARAAFGLAEKRKKHLTYVNKANILRLSDGLFNESVIKVSKDFPQVKVDEYHVDDMSAQLIKNPEKFDVIVTTNLYGDILSDESAQLVGGLGVVAGENRGDHYAMFEAVHGTAPKYKGQNKVNPMAMIFAGTMLLDYLGEENAAASAREAVYQVLKEKRVLTYDLGGDAGTSEVAEEISKKI